MKQSQNESPRSRQEELGQFLTAASVADFMASMFDQLPSTVRLLDAGAGAGALTGASGKLLSLLYRLVFADALGSVDGDLGNMEDFFTSEEPPPATAAMNGDTAPANEVIDVWAS